MTNEEALKLKPGDRVEAKYGTGWRIVEVVHVLVWTQDAADAYERMRSSWKPGPIVGEVQTVHVRSLCRTTKGNRSPATSKPLRKLRLHSGFPNIVTGNVFADWLEENGYPEAAHALRKRFPLVVE